MPAVILYPDIHMPGLPLQNTYSLLLQRVLLLFSVFLPVYVPAHTWYHNLQNPEKYAYVPVSFPPPENNFCQYLSDLWNILPDPDIFSHVLHGKALQVPVLFPDVPDIHGFFPLPVRKSGRQDLQILIQFPGIYVFRLLHSMLLLPRSYALLYKAHDLP